MFRSPHVFVVYEEKVKDLPPHYEVGVFRWRYGWLIVDGHHLNWLTEKHLILFTRHGIFELQADAFRSGIWEFIEESKLFIKRERVIILINFRKMYKGFICYCSWWELKQETTPSFKAESTLRRNSWISCTWNTFMVLCVCVCVCVWIKQLGKSRVSEIIGDWTRNSKIKISK